MDRNYDCLVKVLLCGDSGVGKTCLISQFTDGQVRKSHITTIGKQSFLALLLCIFSFSLTTTSSHVLYFLFRFITLPHMCSISLLPFSPLLHIQELVHIFSWTPISSCLCPLHIPFLCLHSTHKTTVCIVDVLCVIVCVCVCRLSVEPSKHQRMTTESL